MSGSALKFGKVNFSVLFEHADHANWQCITIANRYKISLSELTEKVCIVSIIRNSVMTDGFEDNFSAQNFLFVMTPFGAFHTHKINFTSLKEE